MNGVSTKISASALAGALTGIGLWVASNYGIIIPADVAVYISTLVGFLVGFFVKEKATVNAVVPATTDGSVVSPVTPADVLAPAVDPAVATPAVDPAAPVA